MDLQLKFNCALHLILVRGDQYPLAFRDNYAISCFLLQNFSSKTQVELYLEFFKLSLL